MSPKQKLKSEADARQALEDQLDDALEQTFPASDPPSLTQPGPHDEDPPEDED